MDTTLKGAFRAPTLRLLGPLIKLLLEQGVGAGDFIQFVKTAYIRAACEVGREKFGELTPNVSRVMMLTGLTRPDIVKLLKASDGQAPENLKGRQRAERILAGWWRDPDFQTRRTGQPAVLPFAGSDRSFTALCGRYSGNEAIAPTLRDELIRKGVVRRRSDGRLEVLRRDYADVRLDAEGIAELGERANEVLEALIFNLKSPIRPRVVRRVINVRLHRDWMRRVQPDSERQVDLVADTLDRALNVPERTAEPNARPEDVVQFGYAFYEIFKEGSAGESDIPPDSVDSSGDTRRATKRERKKK